jgi:zinc protease
MNFLRIFIFLCLFATPALAAPVQEVKTKAGLTAWLVEEHSQPLIAVNIAFRDAGRAYDQDGKEGRAAMVSSLLMEGAGGLDSDAFTIALENSAVRLGFSADDDNFYGNLETLSEHKEQAFSYLGMALQTPRFDDEKIKQIKSQTISAIIDGQNKPANLLSRAWQKQIFGNHPYAKEELGTKESVEAISVDELRDFTQNYLTKKNMVISVVGDISASELSALLDKNLSALPENYNPEVKISDIKLPESAKQTVIEQAIPQTMVNFGMGGIKRADPDYIPAFVMNYILGGGGLTSRLALEIREKRGLTYGVNTSLVPMRHAEIFAGGFATRSEKVGEAIGALKDVLKEYAKNGASDKEISDAKEFLTGSFVVGLSSNSSIVNFLTMMQLQNLGIDYMERRNNLIRAVTKEQVNNIAKKLIQLDKLQIVMVGKPQLEESKK